VQSVVSDQSRRCLPQLVSDEDDPALQEQGAEHLQEALHTQALQQSPEVHVLQPGVHRPAQGQHLGNTARRSSPRFSSQLNFSQIAPILSNLIRRHFQMHSGTFPRN